MEDLEKTPLVELVTEISRLEQQIDLLTLKYEKLRLEINRRYPIIEEQEVFVKKKRK